MFTKEMPKTISKMYDIIYKAEEVLGKKFLLEKESRQGEVALFFKEKNENFLYAGFRYSLYQCTRNWFWFGVGLDWKECVVSAFRQRHENTLIQFENYLICPVSEEILEKENYLEETIKIIEEELESLKKVLFL
jgi:hypothetical protein